MYPVRDSIIGVQANFDTGGKQNCRLYTSIVPHAGLELPGSKAASKATIVPIIIIWPNRKILLRAKLKFIIS